MPHETTARSRRGALGLTLIEMSLLIALIGAAIIGLAERQLIDADRDEAALTRTIEDISMVTDALQAWANDNSTWANWPWHLFSLVSGCTHATIGRDDVISAVPQREEREYYRRLGACHIFRPTVTGGYLFKLPASRFPPPDCSEGLLTGGFNCEYHFDKREWREHGVTPPLLTEGVTVQFIIEHRDAESVERLARQIALASPNVTSAPVPGFDHRRVIRFRVFRPTECVGDPDDANLADPLVYRCGEHRVVKFERGDLRGVRRVALRAPQAAFAASDGRSSFDSTPLSGPGITLPAPPRDAISYQMRIGTQGVGRDQYLEMIRDKVPGGGVCTSAERYGHSTCLTTNFPLTWANVRRFQPSGGIALPGFAGLPNGSHEHADPALWHFYGGGGGHSARLREIWDFDRDPLVRLRLSNPVMDDRYSHRSGQTVERDAHHDLMFGTRIRSGRAEPYMHLCADHTWANSTARIDTRRGDFGGYNQYVAEPCKTGVVLGMDYLGDHWDISLSAEPGHRSLQTRLCALEAVAPGVTKDSSC